MWSSTFCKRVKVFGPQADVETLFVSLKLIQSRAPKCHEQLISRISAIHILESDEPPEPLEFPPFGLSFHGKECSLTMHPREIRYSRSWAAGWVAARVFLTANQPGRRGEIPTEEQLGEWLTPKLLSRSLIYRKEILEQLDAPASEVQHIAELVQHLQPKTVVAVVAQPGRIELPYSPAPLRAVIDDATLAALAFATTSVEGRKPTGELLLAEQDGFSPDLPDLPSIGVFAVLAQVASGRKLEAGQNYDFIPFKARAKRVRVHRISREGDCVIAEVTSADQLWSPHATTNELLERLAAIVETLRREANADESADERVRWLANRSAPTDPIELFWYSVQLGQLDSNARKILLGASELCSLLPVLISQLERKAERRRTGQQENIVGEGVEVFSPIFRSWFRRCGALAVQHQSRLGTVITEHEHSIDTAQRKITFGEDTIFDMQVLGTVDLASGSWLWAWNDRSPSLTPELFERSRKLKEMGEEFQIPELALPEFSFRESTLSPDYMQLVHAMSMVSLVLTGADGYYLKMGTSAIGVLLLWDREGRLDRTGKFGSMANECSLILPRFLQRFRLSEHREIAEHYLSYLAPDGAIRWRGSTLSGLLSDESCVEWRFDERGRLSGGGAVFEGAA